MPCGIEVRPRPDRAALRRHGLTDHAVSLVLLPACSSFGRPSIDQAGSTHRRSICSHANPSVSSAYLVRSGRISFRPSTYTRGAQPTSHVALALFQRTAPHVQPGSSPAASRGAVACPPGILPPRWRGGRWAGPPRPRRPRAGWPRDHGNHREKRSDTPRRASPLHGGSVGRQRRGLRPSDPRRCGGRSETRACRGRSARCRAFGGWGSTGCPGEHRVKPRIDDARGGSRRGEAATVHAQRLHMHRPSYAPLVRYRSFEYQAASWDRRVIAKIEHHLGDLFPHPGCRSGRRPDSSP
jgi:hypothetical protein